MNKLHVLATLASISLCSAVAHAQLTFTDIASGHSHNIALRSNGVVVAWGQNYDSQLGLGYTTPWNSPTPPITTPQTVPGMTDVIQIETNHASNLALKQNGTVWAWGKSSHSTYPGHVSRPDHTPYQIPGLNNVVSIAARESRGGIALKSDGTVWQWGVSPVVGEMGSVYTDTPTQISNLTNIVSISSKNARHGLAIKSDGTVWAWGSNSHGQLGSTPLSGSSASPAQYQAAQISGISDAAKVFAIVNTSYAILNDGTVLSWGSDSNGVSNGHLAAGTNLNWRGQPGATVGLQGAVQIEGGSAQGYRYAVINDGSVKAWGYDYYGLHAEMPDNTSIITPTLLTSINQPGQAGVYKLTRNQGQLLLLRTNYTLTSIGTRFGLTIPSDGDGEYLP